MIVVPGEAGARSGAWMPLSACRGLAGREADPWHPVDGDFEAGRAICEGVCPVRAECLGYGLALLAEGPVEGMFGGLTPRELRAAAREAGLPTRKTAKHGTRAMYVAGCRKPCCQAANARYKAAQEAS